MVRTRERVRRESTGKDSLARIRDMRDLNPLKAMEMQIKQLGEQNKQYHDQLMQVLQYAPQHPISLIVMSPQSQRLLLGS
jgi:hypothetical protein